MTMNRDVLLPTETNWAMRGESRVGRRQAWQAWQAWHF